MKKKILCFLLFIMLSSAFAQKVTIAQVLSDSLVLTIMIDDLMIYVEQIPYIYKSIVYSYNTSNNLLLINLDSKKTFAVYCPVDDINNIDIIGFRSKHYEKEL